MPTAKLTNDADRGDRAATATRESIAPWTAIAVPAATPARIATREKVASPSLSSTLTSTATSVSTAATTRDTVIRRRPPGPSPARSTYSDDTV